MAREMSGLPTLSSKERIILELLAAEGSMYGLQLVTASRGRLKRGTVYVTLGRMQQKGLIVADGAPRPTYRATAHGSRVLNAWTRVARALAWQEAK